MHLRLERFVMEEKIREISKKLLKAQTDTLAINILQEITSIGELKKLSIFIKCQKRDIGNNFTAIAIYISTIALVLPAIDKLFDDLPYVYIILSIALTIGFGWGVFKEGVPFINKTNEHNSKVEYLLWLIEEEIIKRSRMD